ncbi:Putative TRAP transporter small permease protein [Saliniradius amylolyticus]|uniref:TRAP transporter small permease protein n=1 Tax=Saliniradius amylolyticus TaxID=2183582 RepID=A0A2S2E5V2_9ALTE|nr:TRAP transporter small permease [Saliniradius amylolyticus]AWL13034.1 Putative TRAP transporter small permease protein [Saliniradius amylolyticus]
MRLSLAWLDKGLSRLLVALTAAIVVCVCWQVLSRYVTQTPSAYSEEIARFLLIWLGILGASYAYRTGAHLGLDLLVNQLSQLWQRRVTVLVHGVVLSFALSVMVLGGIQLMALAIDPGQQSSALQLNMAWVYAVLPISGVVISVYACSALISVLRES